VSIKDACAGERPKANLHATVYSPDDSRPATTLLSFEVKPAEPTIDFEVEKLSTPAAAAMLGTWLAFDRLAARAPEIPHKTRARK
jgi:hypothetical protein